jgi:chaperonin cofactor prefoldin
MDTNRNSVESQLRTRCNILESQVEILEKQKSNSPEKFIARNNAQAEQWKEVAGIGRFPA